MQPKSRHSARPARDQQDSDRTSEQGTTFDAALVRDFITAALGHDALADAVDDLLHDHVVRGKYHPSVVAASLRAMIDEVLNVATGEDWQQIADELIADARACDSTGGEE